MTTLECLRDAVRNLLGLLGHWPVRPGVIWIPTSAVCIPPGIIVFENCWIETRTEGYIIHPLVEKQ